MSSDWFTNLRDRVLEGYTGSASLTKGKLLKVMYLQRQDTERRLNAADHDQLVAGLEAIGREGLAEVIIEHFGPELSFQEQVARASTVDVSESL